MIKEKTTVDPDTGSFEMESSEQQSSSEITCNAKGEYAWKIKVYDDDDDLREKHLATGMARIKNAIQAQILQGEGKLMETCTGCDLGCQRIIPDSPGLTPITMCTLRKPLEEVTPHWE